MNQPEPECCPPFHPEPWDGIVHEWKDKRFIRGRVRTFFNIPLTFGSTMIRLTSLVEKCGAEIPDWLCLSDHTSRWNMDVYLAVDREVPGVDNILLSGTFVSKVYEGGYNETCSWCKEYTQYVSSIGYRIKKWYMWYTTCPKCAKKYGKNYVVIISECEKI